MIFEPAETDSVGLQCKTERPPGKDRGLFRCENPEALLTRSRVIFLLPCHLKTLEHDSKMKLLLGRYHTGIASVQLDTSENKDIYSYYLFISQIS